MSKDLVFLERIIRKSDLDTIEKKVLYMIRQRALDCIVSNSEDTVCKAWVAAVLEYLHNEAKKDVK